MKRKVIRTTAITLVLAGSMILYTGCSKTDTTTSTTAAQSSTIAAVVETDYSDNFDVEFDSDEVYTDWSKDNPITLTLEDDSIGETVDGVTVEDGVVTISKAGTYVISGTLNGSVVVDCADEKVRLVLNGVTINGGDSPAINILAADEAIISLEENTENILSDTSTYADTSDEAATGTLYSKADLCINGTGSLTINAAYNNGIVSKDDLKIVEGTYIINATNIGIKGKDLVAIKDGLFNITSGGDGIKSDNDTEENKGVVYIENGTFDIVAGDDGMHGDNILQIEDGTINISNSYEGLEGAVVTINGGTIDVVATDDGINTAGGSDDTDSQDQDPFAVNEDNILTINGGNLTINAAGDGLDSNGSIYMTSGQIFVSGPTNDGNGSTDYNGEFVVTGGKLIAVGSSGMAQNVSEDSSVPTVLYGFDEGVSSGTVIIIKDADGNEIERFTLEKDSAALLLSSEYLSVGSTYTIYGDGDSIGEFTMDSTVTTSNITANQMGPGMK